MQAGSPERTVPDALPTDLRFALLNEAFATTAQQSTSRAGTDCQTLRRAGVCRDGGREDRRVLPACRASRWVPVRGSG